MGRVRTKTVKRGAKVLLEKYYQRLTNDFHTNKKILSEVAQVPTKSLRNKIAGFATHLMKRIQKGPVKGISLKVQEEERERRLDWVPKTSEIKLDKVEVDDETRDMISKQFGEEFLNKLNLEVRKDTPKERRKGPRGDGERRLREKREGKDGEKRPPREHR